MTTLAEKLIAHPTELFPGFDKRVAAAQHFCFEEGPTNTAFMLADGGEPQLNKIIPLIRMPFRSTWLEVWNAHRPFKNTRGDRVIIPHKIGLLLECDDTLRAGVAHQVWDHPTENLIEVNPIALRFDWNDDGDVWTNKTARNFNHELLTGRHWRLDRSPYSDTFDQMLLTVGWSEQRILQSYQGFFTDWCGELTFFFALIGLLNSRNAIEIEQVDRSRLNRARARKGKAPLFDHRTVRLRLSPQMMRRSGHPSGDHRTMPLHKVRGHFKVRKTGIFFWTPHERGDISAGRIEHDYVVQQKGNQTCLPTLSTD